MADKSLTFNIFGKDVSGSKAVGDFQKKSSEHISSLVKDLAGLAIGYFGVSSAIDFGKQSVEAAQAAETATNKLSVALENTHSKFKATSDSVTNAQSKLSDYGFTGAQVSDALAVMTTGLGSGTKALDHLQVVADLAKYKNIGLSEAALIVTKGLEGQLRPLKALGIDLPVYAGNAQQVALANAKVAAAQQKVNDVLAKYPDAAKAGAKGHAEYEAAVRAEAAAQSVANAKASSGAQIIAALSDKLKGEAAKAADTYAGKWAAVGAKWDDIQVKAGKVLLPALAGIADFLSKKLIPGIEETSDKFSTMLNEKNQAKQASEATSMWNQFFSTWGHGWDQLMGKFGNGWTELMGKFGNGWRELMTGFSSGWNTWLAKFAHGRQQIDDYFTKTMPASFANGWSQLMGKFANGWNQIQGFLSGHPFQAQAAIVWHNLTPPSVQGGGGGSYHITPFADGGIVPSRPGGTIARIGEAGVPEAVVPLTKSNLAAIGGGGSGTEVHVHVTGSFVGSTRELSKLVYTAIVDGQKIGVIPRNAFT